MIKNICFFNDGHNGDLVASKQFVKIFMEDFPNFEYGYVHNKNRKVLLDLPCTFLGTQFPKIKRGTKFHIIDDTLYINTWIGAYLFWTCVKEDKPFNLEFPQLSGINWINYNISWTYIYDICNRILNTNVQKNQNNLNFPHEIDYTKYNCSSSYVFLQKNINKRKILLSNGLVESGQTNINDDMSGIINTVSKIYPEDIFMCTRRIKTESKNVFFTDDIIRDNSGCDLNEIAFISENSDVIIGKNSGPFLFTNNKSNLLDSNKKFLCFGNYYEDSFLYKLSYSCKFHFVNDISEHVMLQEVKNILEV